MGYQEHGIFILRIVDLDQAHRTTRQVGAAWIWNIDVFWVSAADAHDGLPSLCGSGVGQNFNYCFAMNRGSLWKITWMRHATLVLAVRIQVDQTGWRFMQL